MTATAARTPRPPPATTAAATATTAAGAATTAASGHARRAGAGPARSSAPRSTPRAPPSRRPSTRTAIAAFKDDAPGVTINYGGGGSGKGRQDLADQVVDWAGSDGVIKAEDLPKFKGGEVLYFPTVLAPITLSYNLDGVDKLQLTPDTIAKIFQRQITNWNDPAIAADNPDAKLPDQAITVALRSDGSGTTENFTKFLDAAAAPAAMAPGRSRAGSTVAVAGRHPGRQRQRRRRPDRQATRTAPSATSTCPTPRPPACSSPTCRTRPASSSSPRSRRPRPRPRTSRSSPT